MSIPAGMVMRARGYQFGIVSGLVVTAVGALLFVPAAQWASFPFFVCSMFVMASGLCFLETAADTYVNVLGPPEQAPRRLNLAQSFNALGVVVGPLVGGAQWGAGTSLWAQKHFVLGVATQALYVGAQVGIGAYFINLVTETWRGLSSQQAAFLLSLAMVGYLLGRVSSTALLLRVSPRAMLTAYGAVNVMLCLIVSAGLEKASAIALVAVFFFMGTMFATIFTWGVRNLGASTQRGASLMVMAIGGGVLLPYPMERIAEIYGMPAAFLLPALSFAMVALYGWKGAGLDERAAQSLPSEVNLNGRVD